MAGRIALALVSVIVLAAAGLGWWVVRGTVGGITVSQALGVGDPKSGGGVMNVLLMGLDSRKDQDGNDLPQGILDKLHAGDSESGGYNTNTLILAHITADNHVVAFSIPRDDYVTVHNIPGYSQIKIKEAYGLKKAETEQRLLDQGVNDQHELEQQGREAGRTATLAAVRDLTGVPIDYFAEVSLVGFYDLAAALGGIEVCLNQSVHDDYSGAEFSAGRQTLDASQALAFVRQRHGLDNGDLDRTHRQQAFLVSVMRKLQGQGTFSNLTKINALVKTVNKDVVLSTGWNNDILRRVGEIAGGNVQYQTLPVLRYDSVNGQDVNIIDPAAIRSQVKAAFSDGGSTAATADSMPTSTVDVVNAGSTEGLAAGVSQGLVQRGYTAGAVRGPSLDESHTTAIDYGSGASADARHLADLLGISASPHADTALAPRHIRVVLGADYMLPSDFSTSNAVAMPDNATVNTGSGATDSSTSPDPGPPVDGAGLPCVN